MKASTSSSAAERPGLFDASFVSHLSSSQQISKLEAKRLETQWKKICDQEKRSKERNKELLKDFERVEQHAALLAVKTERLKAYKQQYENYINKMYPRWKEELENHRLSELQNRNASTGSASGAPFLTSSSPLRAVHLEPHFSGNTLLSSTPARPPSSTVYNRPPPQTGYPVNQHHSYHQDPYSEFSYHDPSRQHGSNLPPSGYLVSDRRWQTPEYYDSHRHFDSRVHQGQFAANSREPENAYYRSPDHYSRSLGDPFYDRQPPHGEFPRNAPPDRRHMHPDTPHGQSQGTRPAAPYEPRTELQRTFLTHRNQPGPYDQNGQQAHYHDGRQGSYRGYNDQRPDGFEPRRVERSIVNGRDEAQFDKPFLSGFPTRPVIVNGQDTKQLPPEAYPFNQPLVPPEKPLERSIPVLGFPDPSLSSTVIETSLETSETHRDHGLKEDKSFTTPTTSEATPNAVVVKPAEENLVKQQSLPSEEITELSEKPRKLGVEPVKAVEIPQDGNQQNTRVDSVDGKNEKLKDKVSLTLQQENKLEERSDEDDEESLDLSDLSLPDGNKEGLPFIPSQKESARHEDKQEDALRGGSGLSGGTSNPVVPDATKIVTEDISEDIQDSVALDGDEDLNDIPVHDEGEETLTYSGGQAAEQPKEIEISKDVNDEREKDINEVLAKDEMETPLSKTEEERAPSVSVDGFLCLLQAVDADVEVSFSPETLYHSPSCSSDMREEIIRAAEVGDSLQSFDPNTVSMIVLEELPLLGSSSSAGCVIPDRVFSEGASCETEKELRSFMESSLIKLWKALFSHLVNVVKNNVMSAEQVGNMFGSLLIAKSSKYWMEGQLLLRRILEAAISDVSSHSASPPPSPKDHDLDLETRFETEAAFEQELDKVSIGSGGSSSTLGSTPPKVELNKSNEENRKATPDPTVSYEDDFEDEVPLTETAAYQKMMSSAHSEPDDDISDLLGTSGPQKQDSEADDDVERELARTISPPVTSPRQRSPNHLKSAKQKPKLSLFETGTEVKNTEKDFGDSWGGSSLKSVKSDISDSESVVSPPLSPDFGVGYTPTALENNEQKNKLDKENDKSEPKSASDSKAKRKTDFWNTSDTESEVDLQLSTGGLDQDDDDFDFYG